MPEVLDTAASVDRADADSEEKRTEAPVSAPSRLSFSHLPFHLGDLAVDTVQAGAYRKSTQFQVPAESQGVAGLSGTELEGPTGSRPYQANGSADGRVPDGAGAEVALRQQNPLRLKAQRELSACQPEQVKSPHPTIPISKKGRTRVEAGQGLGGQGIEARIVLHREGAVKLLMQPLPSFQVWLARHGEQHSASRFRFWVLCQRDRGFTRLVGDCKALANEARSLVGKRQGLILRGGCECTQGKQERKGQPVAHVPSLPWPAAGGRSMRSTDGAHV